MLREEMKNSTSLSDNSYKMITTILESEGYKITPPDKDEGNDVASMLEIDEKGKVLQSNYNCQYALRNDPVLKGAIKFNELSQKYDICKDLGWHRESPSFSDTDLDNIITYLETMYHLKNDKMIERAVRVVGKENRYHPIREKLLSLKWDGKSRIGDALHYFLGVEKTKLATESLKVFMLGAVARVFEPGKKFELMLCLVGGQGAGKSTFLRFLAMDDIYFSDDIKRLDDDRAFQRLQGHWIIEMPEMLAVLNSKKVEETKSFVSRQYDNYRAPYDKYAVDHPRQCVFAGTSNKSQFLPMDKSGNRRFLPIEVHMENAECHILDNEAHSRAYIEQLWAEIMVIYKSGDYSLTLPKELNDELLKTQERYSPEDPIETAIRNYLEEKKPEYVCIRMLFLEALNHAAYETAAQWESNAISEIMDQKMNDYAKLTSHRFKEYGTQRAWRRINLPDFEPDINEDENPFID